MEVEIENLEDKKKYTLKLTASSHRAIRFLAYDLNMSMSELIQKIIDRYLEKREKKKEKL